MAGLPQRRRQKSGQVSRSEQGRDLSSGFSDLFERFLSSVYSGDDLAGRHSELSVPLCDIEENESSYELSFELPGLKKEDIHIDLHGDQLMISGERKEEKEKKEKSRYYSERSYGSFYRSFTLPQNVDSERVEADYEDGLLKLTLPKTEEQSRKRIEIGQKRQKEKGKAA